MALDAFSEWTIESAARKGRGKSPPSSSSPSSPPTPTPTPSNPSNPPPSIPPTDPLDPLQVSIQPLWIPRLIALSTCALFIYIVIAFTVRYRRGNHCAVLAALVGSSIALASTAITYTIWLIPRYDLLCGSSLVITFHTICGTVATVLLVLHYTLKARILNLVPGEWTTVQMLSMTFGLFYAISVVIGLLAMEIRKGPGGSCTFHLPTWAVMLAGSLLLISTVMPMMCFVAPLISAWAELTCHRRASMRERMVVFWASVCGREAVHSLQSVQLKDEIQTVGSTCIDPAVSKSAVYAPSLPDIPEDLSTETETDKRSGLDLFRSRSFQVSHRARVVRRVFMAAGMSVVTTSLAVVLHTLSIGGPAVGNTLFRLNMALTYLWAVVALPLPGETLDVEKES